MSGRTPFLWQLRYGFVAPDASVAQDRRRMFYCSNDLGLRLKSTLIARNPVFAASGTSAARSS